MPHLRNGIPNQKIPKWNRTHDWFDWSKTLKIKEQTRIDAGRGLIVFSLLHNVYNFEQANFTDKGEWIILIQHEIWQNYLVLFILQITWRYEQSRREVGGVTNKNRSQAHSMRCTWYNKYINKYAGLHAIGIALGREALTRDFSIS